MGILFEIINSLNKSSKNMVSTIIEGESVGDKLIVSDGRILYNSRNGGFLSEHLTDLLNINESKEINIKGRRIFCEVIGNEKKIVICGGGHISIPIIQISKMIDFKVIVLEDRPSFADNARKAGADLVFCESFIEGLSRIEGDKDTFFVIVTRGHRHDQACLEKIILKENAYIGMIGSKIRVKKVKEELIEKGVDSNKLEKVYTPIGLKINAETPSEIAVAIMGEIIQVKNKSHQEGGYSKEILDAILNKNENMKVAMATIISKKGPAPRDVCTKMLIFEDGRLVGTIGGGCVEADVVQKSLNVIRLQKPMLYTVDMTGEEAEDEGMVCGGKIDIFIELL